MKIVVFSLLGFAAAALAQSPSATDAPSALDGLWSRLLGLGGSQSVCLVGVLCDPIMSIVGNLTADQRSQLDGIVNGAANSSIADVENQIRSLAAELSPELQAAYREAAQTIDDLRANLTNAVTSPEAQVIVAKLASILNDSSLSFPDQMNEILVLLQSANPSLIGEVSDLVQQLLSSVNEILTGTPLSSVGGVLDSTGLLGGSSGLLASNGAVGGILSGL